MAVTIAWSTWNKNDCVVKSVTIGVSVFLLLFFVVFLVDNEACELRKDALVQAVTVF